MTDKPKQYRYKHGLTAERRKLIGGEECVIVRAPYMTLNGMAMSVEEFERDYEEVPEENDELNWPKPTAGKRVRGTLRKTSIREPFSIENNTVEQAERGWLPIETAPKDGTRILVTDGYSCSVVSWCNYWAIGIFGEYGDSDNEFYDATHWMRLPKPPVRGV